MNLVFVSNLFPSEDEPIRGLDNATLLPFLLDSGIGSIRALGLRPTLNPLRWGKRADVRPRNRDAPLHPTFVGVPYLPKIGSALNHHLLHRAVSPTLQRLHREQPIDAVLVSWLYPDGCGVGRWCAAHGIPYVMICQGSDAHVYLENPVRRRLILEAISKSRSVITRSADLAARLSENGADPAKLFPIYNGIDTSIFSPGDPATARSGLDLPPDIPVLLFVGNLLPVKNPLFLIDAWKRVLASRPCTLVMVGTGPLESQIREAAGDHLPHLVLAGRLGPEGVANSMRAADVLCLTSRGEGVPNVVLEAFGCGLPVVSTDVGGIGEVLKGNAFGRLVPAGDLAGYVNALEDIFAVPPSRNFIADTALNFSWESAAEKYATRLL